jgi:hypothetical protein
MAVVLSDKIYETLEKSYSRLNVLLEIRRWDEIQDRAAQEWYDREEFLKQQCDQNAASCLNQNSHWTPSSRPFTSLQMKYHESVKDYKNHVDLRLSLYSKAMYSKGFPKESSSIVERYDHLMIPSWTSPSYIRGQVPGTPEYMYGTIHMEKIIEKILH